MSSSTSSEVVVHARHLGKAYQLYARRGDWLKQVMLGWWKSYYKPFWVLRDIDLDVYRGESIGILGRNGCGKSTLLQVICGMTLPSNGELRVNGRIAPVLALGATFDAELSGRENIMIGGAVMGLKRAEILRDNLFSMFPKLPKNIPPSRIKTWFGHRPSMPDGRPCIGYARATRDVVYAFGHGHVGLVGSARTGRLVAQLLSGKPPEIPLEPFAPTRFL